MGQCLPTAKPSELRIRKLLDLDSRPPAPSWGRYSFHCQLRRCALIRALLAHLNRRLMLALIVLTRRSARQLRYEQGFYEILNQTTIRFCILAAWAELGPVSMRFRIRKLLHLPSWPLGPGCSRLLLGSQSKNYCVWPPGCLVRK